MDRAPRVSVCIPTYRYARYVGQAVESVLAQTFGDLELIVVDDASDDETMSVLAGYRDPRLRLMRNERNLGLFPNFNRCLELARGKFVKILCADDWLDPRYLADAVALLEAHPRVGLVTAPGFLVDDAGETYGYSTAGFGDRSVIPAADALSAQAEHLNVIGMPSSVLMRRAAAKEAGGFEEAFAPAGDVHLWLKLLARHDLGWVSAPRCYLRIHQAKSHDYGPDPTESTLLAWKDAASRSRSAIGSGVLQRALDAEAERSLLYAAAHLAAGRPARAWSMLAFTRRHVRMRRALARLLLHSPRIARGQAARLAAPRLGRMVVYSPPPRLGPHLDATAGSRG